MSRTPPALSHTSGTSTTTTAPGTCTSAQLRLTLTPGSPGAGQRYATLALVNTGSTTCRVKGYGGLGLVDDVGSPILTHQVRVARPAPTSVTLAPGASATSQLHWSAVAGTGDSTTGDCQPTASSLQVIPPDETHPLSLAWDGGPVCEQGRIDQQAYVAGT